MHSKPMKKLCLAEHDYQAAHFLEQADVGDAAWIALGPLAMHYLSQRGIPYNIPEDYCSPREVEAACVAQFENLTRVCRELDTALLETHPFLKEWIIRPFFFHLWQLGQITDNLLCRGLQLKKILDHYGDHEVYIHRAPPQPWDEFGIGFSRQETLWGKLLALSGWSMPLHFLPEPMQDEVRVGTKQTRWHNLRRHLRSIFSYVPQNNIILYTILQSVRKGYTSNIINSLRYSKVGKRNGLAILNGLYEWESILSNLIGSNHPAFFLYGPALQKQASSARWKETVPEVEKLIQENFYKFCSSAPINYFSIIKERVAFIGARAPAIAQAEIINLERFLDPQRVVALLTCVGRDFGSYVAKQYCRIKGIKVFCWQHGAAWFYQRHSQRFDLNNVVSTDKLLVYGNAVKNSLASSPLVKEEHCEIVPVGMPSLRRLETIVPSRSRENLRILWPFGGYYWNSWYCGFSPPQNDRLYYTEQMIILANILGLLNNYPQMSCTVKLYPDSYPDPPWVIDLARNKRIRLIWDSPNFVELLPQHDLVIIDSPTTTLLQAVATRLPVFVLMSVIRWPDEAVEILRRRACYAPNALELMEELNQYIKADNSKVDISNRDFLKYYGSHHGDGPARAMAQLREVLEGHSQNKSLSPKTPFGSS